MKIAVYHNLPSGGGKRALYEMVCRLSRSHHLDVYTISSAEHEFCDIRPFSKCHFIYQFFAYAGFHSPFGRLNPAVRVLNLVRLREIQKKIADDIEQKGYDLAFIHNCQISQAPELLRMLKIPSIYYCGEPPRELYEPHSARPYQRESAVRNFANRVDPIAHAYHSILKQIDQASTKSASLVLTNSAYSRESLYKVYGINARVCYLGVDLEKFEIMHLAEQDFMVSVGSLNGGKGFDFLVRSIALLDKGNRPGLVVIANYVEAREKRFLEQLALAAGVKLEIKVMVPDSILVQSYNRAKLTLYAPIMEPFGFVPLESMACGKMVVGIREAGLRESIEHEINGLLTERDPEEFANAIDCMLKDESARRSMGLNGRKSVERKWRWERTIETLERNFQRVLQ